jgi:uncharacterized membrane protein YgdD (TMEM256/DUF423 family)
MNQKFYIGIAGVLGALVVILGAFGAHALKTKLEITELATFETGVKYHFYHTIALLIIGLLMERYPSQLLNIAGISFITGIVLFSGSLYLLATRSLIGGELKWLGPITPFGGLAFVIGWLSVSIAMFKK